MVTCSMLEVPHCRLIRVDQPLKWFDLQFPSNRCNLRVQTYSNSQALTEPENSASYCFTVKPDPTSSCTVTLTYEKRQKDISVSASYLLKMFGSRYREYVTFLPAHGTRWYTIFFSDKELA
ncbi:hypothetical protein GOODEAATRI_029592 [Goodea atripinnis]|uniref:Uncharacterized protein n=1 Tax=Goodea atripinnis TaxID=208336 RepID=A0ABV0PSR1_9TELE